MNPTTRLLADTPANPHDESNRRGSHIRRTKYTTQKTEVFGTNEIRRKIWPRGNPIINPDLYTVRGFTPLKSKWPEWYSLTPEQGITYQPDATVTVQDTQNKGGVSLGVRSRYEDMTAHRLQRKKH